MSVSDRVRGRTNEDVSTDDISRLLDDIEKGGAESFKPARTLVEAAERYPDLVAQHHDRLASVLDTSLPSMVRRHLYDVVLEIDITSANSLKRIIDSAETDLIEGDPSMRSQIYQIIKIAANNGVDISNEHLRSLLNGVAASPANTPATVAMEAYIAAVTQRDKVGNEELTPMIDLIESDFPEVRSAAFDALVKIINLSEIKPSTNTDGFRITIESYGSSEVAEDRVTAALESLE